MVLAVTRGLDQAKVGKSVSFSLPKCCMMVIKQVFVFSQACGHSCGI